ncbi:MAG: hypothetical protein ACRD2G_13705 [Terriglobia bacterium]
MSKTLKILTPFLLGLIVAVPFIASGGQQAQPAQEAQPVQRAATNVPRMTGRYHFLGPEDALSILQEEGLLKGYIDVFEGDSESDDVLSYQITIGSRKGDHVEFKTRTIHEKYYRFNGTVERGAGKKPGDPDYLQLDGELQTITLNSVTGEQKAVKQQVVLKSIPRGEGPAD